MLARDTITAKVEDFSVTLPHPANFALHKLLISQRRPNPQKEEKDRDAAARILEALIIKGEQNTIKKVFLSLPARWQNKIKKASQSLDNKDISDIFLHAQ